MSETFNSVLEAIPGLVPIEVSLAHQGIAWGDIGRFELRQALYDWGLQACRESTGIKSIVQTPLEVLADEELIVDALKPSGFLFHMSRCGSSLLAKALAHGRENLMISEPEPLNQLLFFLTEDLTRDVEAPEGVTMLRNMISALGRKRGLEKRFYVLKFTSWNVLLARTIVDAFPDVPSVFLYRDPEEVMVSIARNATGFARAQASSLGPSMSGCDRASMNAMSPERYVAAVLANMLASATSVPTVRFLNYSHVNTEQFPKLLELFSLKVDASTLESMSDQFRYDSKNPRAKSTFADDSGSKRAEVTPAIQAACEEWLSEPYRAMQSSRRNLIV